MSRLDQAGPHRRYAIAALLNVVAVAAVATGISLANQSLWAATGIFSVSLVGFHIAALLTSDCTRAWRAVDYPWVLATFMAIVIALTNIYEADRSRRSATALEMRRQAYQSLLYVLRSTITNDCHPKPSRADMWTPSPEPYDGACDRMEHFLPQIEDAAAREEKIEEVNTGAYWGRNIVVLDTDPVGSWSTVYLEADRFTKNAEEVRVALERLESLPPSPIGAWAKSESLKYWYFILAFFLGLRLSRVTADLLGASRAAGSVRATAASETVEAGAQVSAEVRGSAGTRPLALGEVKRVAEETASDSDGDSSVTSSVAAQPSDAAGSASRRS